MVVARPLRCAHDLRTAAIRECGYPVDGLDGAHRHDAAAHQSGFRIFLVRILKFFHDQRPAQDLAARTIEALSGGRVRPAASLPVLAVWETLIGLGLLTGRFLRVVILLLLVQMFGTLTPLVLFTDEVFTRVPFVPTLEGQYIIKNAVLISAAIVLGATVRGGGLVARRIANAADQPESN